VLEAGRLVANGPTEDVLGQGDALGLFRGAKGAST
jgi:hypothetical protein